jgi:hypothetical protein
LSNRLPSSKPTSRQSLLRSRAVQYEGYAARCEVLARSANDATAKAAFRQAATDWLNLAVLIRSLQTDLKDINAIGGRHPLGFAAKRPPILLSCRSWCESLSDAMNQWACCGDFAGASMKIPARHHPDGQVHRTGKHQALSPRTRKRPEQAKARHDADAIGSRKKTTLASHVSNWPS